MAGREREVKVTVLGDSKGGQRALNDLDDKADKTGRRFDGLGGKMASFAKVAAVGLGAAAVGTGLFLKSAVEAAEESRKVMAQTDAVIKSTGGVARVTAKDVDTLASSLSAMSGIDDEVIAGGQNLLLTFTQVRNEVGKGNDIFTQATKAALNMSVALGTDMNSASMLVGKALNDPIKGMTALTRSGIQFTEQQKAQVKAMVAAGDTLGAQKIILKELETQFGGSAAAAASPMERLKVAFGNIQEEIGARLLPVVGAAATFLANVLPRAFETAERAIAPVIELVHFAAAGFKAAFSGEGVTSTGFVGVMERIGVAARAAFDVIVPAAQAVAGFVRDNLMPILAALAVVIGAVLVGAVQSLLVSLAALFSPVVLIVGAIALLVAGIVYAYNHFEAFRSVVQAVIEFLTGVILPAIGAFAGYIIEQFGALVGWVQAHWSAIQEAIGHVIAVVQVIIETFVAVVMEMWATFGDEILGIARVVWDQIRNVVETVVNLIRGIIEVGLALINGEWGAAWDGIKGILATAWEYISETVVNALRLVGQVIEAGLSAIVSLVGGLPGRVLAALGSLGGWLYGAGQDLIWGFVNGIGSMARTLANAAVNVARGAVNAVKSFLGIGSPSKLFAGFGVNMGEGMVQGLDRSHDRVARAGQSMAAASLPSSAGAGLTGLALSNTGPPGGAPVPGIVINIAGTVVTERDLIEAVQAGLLQKQRRVPTLGLT